MEGFISEKISKIRSRIQVICNDVGVDTKMITLVGVTKYTTVEDMELAIAAGIADIGENKVQDARQKFTVLHDKGLAFRRHMIGHLQTNKVKEAVALFDMIQSVDSIRVAREIDKQASRIGKVMEVLVQVNSSGEKQKFGVDPEELLDLIEDISKLEHVYVRGLMTIGLLTKDQENIARCFLLTKSLFGQVKEKFSGNSRVDMKYLSMGMSQDYPIALRYGANMIRVGSAIFA